MAKWQRHIYLNPEWDQAQNNEISPQELSASIARKLKSLHPFTGDDDYLDMKKDDLIYEFEGMADDEVLTMEEFNDWMQELYDWGDTQIGGKFFDAVKVCWIDTMTHMEVE